MEQRKLGGRWLTVSALGLGCMGMSEFYGRADPYESTRTIRRALDLGITFFDTADMYGPFTNEDLVGHVLRPFRREVVIATKFGFERRPDGSYVGINGRPEYVRAACEASLQRLDIDCIDLYYQHRVDPTVPIEDTVGAMVDLVRAGKVRFLGLSEAGPTTIGRAHAVHPITALQTEYSVWSRDVEPDILPTLRELGIGLVAYSPLGRGFLTGRPGLPDQLDADDFRRGLPRWQDANYAANLSLLAPLTALARERGGTPAQLALAWVLAKGADIVPIVGTTRREHLLENANALALELTLADVAALDEAFPPGAAAGTRYAEASMQRLGL